MVDGYLSLRTILHCLVGFCEWRASMFRCRMKENFGSSFFLVCGSFYTNSLIVERKKTYGLKVGRRQKFYSAPHLMSPKAFTVLLHVFSTILWTFYRSVSSTSRTVGSSQKGVQFIIERYIHGKPHRNCLCGRSLAVVKH